MNIRTGHSDWSKSSSQSQHYIHPARAWLLRSHLCHFGNKHGGQLNEIFIYSEDITPSLGYLKGWRIFKMHAVALGPKSLSKTRIQGI